VADDDEAPECPESRTPSLCRGDQLLDAERTPEWRMVIKTYRDLLNDAWQEEQSPDAPDPD